MRKAWFILFLLLFSTACGDDDVTVVCDDVPCIQDNIVQEIRVCGDEDKIKFWKKHGVTWDELFGWHPATARPMESGG